MHPKENIVASDDLSIDLAFSKCSDCALSIVFEQVNEGHNTENVDVFQEVLALCLEESGDFSLGDLLAAKANASVALKRHLFDEVLIFVDLDL